MAQRMAAVLNFCQVQLDKDDIEELISPQSYWHSWPTWQSNATPLFFCGNCSSTLEILPQLQRHYQLPMASSLLSLQQSSGRGQFGRQWLSPLGNLYVSVLLHPSCFSQLVPPSLLLAAAVVQSLQAMGISVQLKWPNDIVCYRRGQLCKAGGMLLESRGEWLYWGVALNIEQAPTVLAADSLPATILPMASAMLPLLPSWKKLLQQVWSLLYSWRGLTAAVLLKQQVEPLLALRNQTLLFQSGSACWQQAELLGLALDGAAILRLGSKVQHLYSGSLRPL